MTRTFKTLLHCIVGCVLVFGTGCCSHKKDPFDAQNFDPFDLDLSKRVEAYQQTKFPNLSNEKTGTPRVYVDFSNGIIYAYKSNPDNPKVIDAIAQKLTVENIDWYKLANSSIEELPFNSKELYNRVVDPNSYSKDIMAPIESAIKEITSLHNDALLITDFEEYESQGADKGKEQFVAFATQPFGQWLAKGNSISFYITDYQEKTKDNRTVDKHLYFTVFTYGNKSDASLLSQIEYALNGRSFSMKRYDLTTTPYTLTNEYAAQKTGGCFYDMSGKDEKSKNVLDLKGDCYVNGLEKNNHFEFYQFGIDWKTIEVLKNDYQKQNQFKDFFRKLYIDLSNEDEYVIDNLDVKVYDVTDDYIHFAKCNEVLMHKPKIIKGSNGEDKIDENTKDDIALVCYEPNGAVKKDWMYTSAGNDGAELKEFFTLNKELFNNTKRDNKSKVEIGTTFHSHFISKNVRNPSGLIRADIVIADAQPNLSNPKLDLFKWNSATEASKQNKALYESIRNTIGSPSVKPVNKVIYSYYIKTL